MPRKKNSEKKNKIKKRKNSNSKKSRESMNSMKYEIANEFGVDLGPEASSNSKKNGGEFTKRLVDFARNSKKKCK